MEKELLAIFMKTFDAHFPARTGITKDEYWTRFKVVLAGELPNAPKIDFNQGNLAIYLKLSVLVLAMIKLYEQLGLSEYEIGEAIYKAAEKFYQLSPVKKWMQNKLFFTRLTKRQILNRQAMATQLENGINGFKFVFVEGNGSYQFGIDYVQCGICDYFRRMNRFKYVKYCCLVDYAIMKNMGIAFWRTTTIGNGGQKCDFRFSKRGKIEDGWPPINLREFNAYDQDSF